MKTILLRSVITCLSIATLCAKSPTPAPSPSATPTVEEIRVQKEAALLRVKDIMPLRAKEKMDELLDRGIPISAAVQAAVNQALRPSPTPGARSPTPINDGL